MSKSEIHIKILFLFDMCCHFILEIYRICHIRNKKKKILRTATWFCWRLKEFQNIINTDQSFKSIPLEVWLCVPITSHMSHIRRIVGGAILSAFESLAFNWPIRSENLFVLIGWNLMLFHPRIFEWKSIEFYLFKWKFNIKIENIFNIRRPLVIF